MARQAALEPIDPAGIYGRTERIIEYFFEEERRSAFTALYKDLQMAYEVLAPDPFLVDYLGDYRLVTDVYQTMQSYYATDTEKLRAERQFLGKTAQLISEHVGVYDVSAPMPLYPINRNIADVIAQDHIPERVKVINLQRSITAYIEENIERAPYLTSIGAEVEKVIEQLRQKQISVQTAGAVEATVDRDGRRRRTERSTLGDLALRCAPACAPAAAGRPRPAR